MSTGVKWSRAQAVLPTAAQCETLHVLPRLCPHTSMTPPTWLGCVTKMTYNFITTHGTYRPLKSWVADFLTYEICRQAHRNAKNYKILNIPEIYIHQILYKSLHPFHMYLYPKKKKKSSELFMKHVKGPWMACCVNPAFISGGTGGGVPAARRAQTCLHF